MNIIQFNNVSFKYMNHGKDRSVIKNLSFNIREKEITLLYGKSGVGKTTILNIIAGLLTPQEGEVLVNSKNLCKLPRKELDRFRSQNIGFIFQMFYLIPQFTVVDNVIIGMKNSRKSYHEKKKEALEILNKFSIEEYALTYPEYLSGGQQQRVAIARAVANNSSIILADEPTGNLDQNTSLEVFSILTDLKNRGKTVVIVSHDEIVKQFCDNIIDMETGCQESVIGEDIFEFA